MQCESHFKSSFGNVKAFNLKKLKLSLSPSLQWPQSARRLGATAGKFLSQTVPKAGPSLERNPSNQFQKPSRSSVETYTWNFYCAEAQCSLGANLNRASLLLLNCPSGRQVSSSH